MIGLHNPFSAALFAPVMLRVVALLLAGALLAAVVERRRLLHPHTLRDSVLAKRVLSWALMAPAFVIGVFTGGPASLLVVGYLGFQASREFASVTGMSTGYRAVLFILGAGTLLIAAFAPALFMYTPVAAFLVLNTLALTRASYRDATAALFGFMYLPLMLGFFLLIGRHMNDGIAVLLLLGMAVALSDVLAFVAGSVIGGRRLAPRLSPNKTLAGVGGNIAGAYLAFAVMGFVIPTSWPAALAAALPALIALACVWGDLLESLIKRAHAVKDAGSLLPGFGGILDRIDSLIVALPVTYFTVRLFA